MKTLHITLELQKETDYESFLELQSKFKEFLGTIGESKIKINFDFDNDDHESDSYGDDMYDDDDSFEEKEYS